MKPERIAQFWSHVEKTGGCWLWRGTKRNPEPRRAYGVFRKDGQRVSAHRLAWELQYGPIPAGRGYHGTCVLHSCDNPSCVRPQHLFLGTNGDNVADSVRKGRRARGERSATAKLTEKQVKAIRQRAAAGETCSILAKAFGVSSPTISGIVRRKYWPHVA